jgi:class 3 adenylate cyclase/pimeloyl-ACP methyl ester carboxylesterase
MSEANEERRLLAILFTDVVGYTALTERDEARAVRVRDRHRELVKTLVAQFDGELVDATGDESLSVFASALHAVDCALALQAALRDDPHLRVRAGIHVGDVLRRGNEVIGEGVNVAARIRPLAEPGGICVSDAVWKQVHNRPHLAAQSLGAQTMKNVGERFEVFALDSGAARTTTPWHGRTALRLGLGLLVTVAIGYATYLPNRAAVLSSVALNVPRLLGTDIEQQIAFATTSDDVRIAYATTGDGPPVVHVLGWATHLTEGLGSPLYDRAGILRAMSEDHRYVRYDGRGFGLSEREVSDFSLDARVRDLAAVVEAAGLERFSIVAVSAGGPTGVAYAARHPERVSRLVLASTLVSGADLSEEPRERALRMFELFRVDWDSAVVRSMAVEWLFPGTDEVTRRVMSEFFHRSGEGSSVGAFLTELMDIDAKALAARVQAPTLVIHGRDDQPVPLEAGRLVASLVPGARFEVVAGGHLEGTGGSPEARKLMLDFLAEESQPGGAR